MKFHTKAQEAPDTRYCNLGRGIQHLHAHTGITLPGAGPGTHVIPALYRSAQ